VQRRQSVAGHATEFLLALATTVAAGLLRLEALVGSYGVVPLGTTLETLQARLAPLGTWLHGGRLTWPQLGERAGDPLAYLNNARAMTWFYQGRAREPVFNYVTRWWLERTNNADIAVSVASALFSVLCVPATYLLGRLAFGPAVGLMAAVVIAIEPETISWGVQGWRDDTFTFFFLAFSAACLLFRARPSRGNAALLTMATALALLTRLTALSFVAPAFLLLAWEVRRKPAMRGMVWRRLAACAVVGTVLVAPYLVNCWTTLGDPFVAVNRNTDFYRARAGQQVVERVRTDAYLVSLVRERPVATADTVLQGLTTYPFMNKFQALHVWSPWLPRVLQALTLGGLLTWLWSPLGRWLLMLLVSSLLPYAFTWEIPGGAEWRFTMHAYPIYLIAAASFLTTCAAAITSLSKGGAPAWRRIMGRAAASVVLAGTVAATLLWLPYVRVRETLAITQNAVVTPGWRDLVFFRRDWQAPFDQDGVASRVSRGQVARVWVPLVPGRGYRVTAAIAPVSSGSDSPVYLRVYLDGRRVAWGQLPSARFSDYNFELDPAAVGSSRHVIEFRASRLPDTSEAARGPGDGQLDEGTTIRLRSLTIAMHEPQGGHLRGERDALAARDGPG